PLQCLPCARRAHPVLHSFPTRRSSDLSARSLPSLCRESKPNFRKSLCYSARSHHPQLEAFDALAIRRIYLHGRLADCRMGDSRRSEEHTSELQSHLNLVCRLLLEKKNS